MDIQITSILTAVISRYYTFRPTLTYRLRTRFAHKVKNGLSGLDAYYIDKQLKHENKRLKELVAEITFVCQDILQVRLTTQAITMALNSNSNSDSNCLSNRNYYLSNSTESELLEAIEKNGDGVPSYRIIERQLCFIEVE